MLVSTFLFLLFFSYDSVGSAGRIGVFHNPDCKTELASTRTAQAEQFRADGIRLFGFEPGKDERLISEYVERSLRTQYFWKIYGRTLESIRYLQEKRKRLKNGTTSLRLEAENFPFLAGVLAAKRPENLKQLESLWRMLAARLVLIAVRIGVSTELLKGEFHVSLDEMPPLTRKNLFTKATEGMVALADKSNVEPAFQLARRRMFSALRRSSTKVRQLLPKVLVKKVPFWVKSEIHQELDFSVKMGVEANENYLLLSFLLLSADYFELSLD